ncbi:hypothetical protein [Pseudomonas citronellolis]|uniref:hypothetical protein n=1 Tax=Pseudomonas citronellolis TaxID=53408 RepID=UPI0023E3D363|nr:hypothetical protein [Pseudomonas citronellolis]MDF3932296.1 hypothetical protein [Pseudomonas citronellolis]
MKAWLPVLLLSLTACAEHQPAPVRVEVPVAIPCRAPIIAEPAWATGPLHPTDSLQTKVRALLAERQQRLGYEARLRAALQACR